MAETRSYKKTRIAPTPSGYLHLGNILSFAITAALAKKTGAKILLRIDDMDQERADKRYVQDIFDTLNFLEIPWDEGPRNDTEFEKEYSQLHHIGLYQKALQQLQEQGNVFACSCTRSQLLKNNPDGIYPGTCRDKNIPLSSENVNWRLNTADNHEIIVNTPDSILRTPLPENMRDFVVRKKDGSPAYQLTSVVDDLYFGVDLIVRGEDLRASTLAQLYLSSLLQPNEFPDITFYHHPLLLAPDGSKLSKSAGATSVRHLREQHKKPAEIYTLIAQAMGLKETVATWGQLAGSLAK